MVKSPKFPRFGLAGAGNLLQIVNHFVRNQTTYLYAIVCTYKRERKVDAPAGNKQMVEAYIIRYSLCLAVPSTFIPPTPIYTSGKIKNQNKFKHQTLSPITHHILFPSPISVSKSLPRNLDPAFPQRRTLINAIRENWNSHNTPPTFILPD
jgi:hypothetical protein